MAPVGKTPASSRKRTALTLEEKVKVIRLNEKGEGSRKLAAEFKVGKTQINNIVKNKDLILAQWEGGENAGRKLVKERRGLYPGVNDKVLEWFCRARAKNIPVTGKLLQEKATLISLDLGYDGFSASNGWLHRFQARYNIKFSAEEETWDEYLIPLLPSGQSLADCANMDQDTVVDKTNDAENRDEDLIQSASAPKDADKDGEETSAPPAKKMSVQTAWSHSTALMDYALQSDNPELVSLMAKAQDILKQDTKKAVQVSKQTKLDLFFK